MEEPSEGRRERHNRRIPGTSLLDVGVRSEDPVFAAHAANFIARVYIDDSQRRASGFSLRGLAKLEEQLATTEETRLKAIERLNAFKKESGILSGSTSQALGIARLTELDRASVDAQAQLASAQAAVDTIERWRKAGMNLDSLPECVGNPALSSFKMARLEAQGALVKALRDLKNGELNLKDFVSERAKAPLLFEPGSKYQYSICHDILAGIVEIVTGKDYDTYLKENIFEPLGMSNTYFASFQKIHDEIADMLSAVGSTTTKLQKIFADLEQLLEKMANGNFNIRTSCEEEYIGEYQGLLQAIRQMNRKMDSALKDVRNASEMVSVGSTNMAEGAQALAEGATDQAASVEEMLATMNELTSGLEKCAVAVDEAYQKAQAAASK